MLHYFFRVCPSCNNGFLEERADKKIRSGFSLLPLTTNIVVNPFPLQCGNCKVFFFEQKTGIYQLLGEDEVVNVEQVDVQDAEDLARKEGW